MTGESGLLRRAATLARDTANAAPRGPWTTTDFDQSGDWWLLAGDGDAIARTRYWPGGIGDDTGDAGQTAAHVALWHPQATLAVATLLDHWAWISEHFPDQLHRRDAAPVLETARALLNEEPTHE